MKRIQAGRFRLKSSRNLAFFVETSKGMNLGNEHAAAYSLSMRLLRNRWLTGRPVQPSGLVPLSVMVDSGQIALHCSAYDSMIQSVRPNAIACRHLLSRMFKMFDFMNS